MTQTWQQLFGADVLPASRRAFARRIGIHLSKLTCLKPPQWLNDEVINKCLAMMQVWNGMQVLLSIAGHYGVKCFWHLARIRLGGGRACIPTN